MYGHDKFDCEHCGAPTKRININTELPSCCPKCDKLLESEHLLDEESTDETS